MSFFLVVICHAELLVLHQSRMLGFLRLNRTVHRLQTGTVCCRRSNRDGSRRLATVTNDGSDGAGDDDDDDYGHRHARDDNIAHLR